MSQSTSTMTAAEFASAHADYIKNMAAAGQTCGPCFAEPGGRPLIWHDQIFQAGITPSGTVTCTQALRVGATQNGLDIILVGSHTNTGDITAASGATITVTLLQADAIDGTYTEVGPTICVKAPTEGIRAEPCCLFARFPLGNFSKAWLKAKLEFTGTISGGKVDCALSYVAR